MEELSKRLTLHDLAGYWLSGTLVLIGLGCVGMVFDLQNKPVVTSLIQVVECLHLTVQVTLALTVAYFLGLVSLGVGALLYYVFVNLSGLEEMRGSRDVDWPLSAEVMAGFSSKVAAASKISGAKERDQVSFAYSFLLNNKKDAFVQLMSGRVATYECLSGAFALIAVAALVAAWQTDAPLNRNWLFGGLILFVAEVWCLYCARAFHRWWRHHVVFGFLAHVPKPQSDKVSHAKVGRKH